MTIRVSYLLAELRVCRWDGCVSREASGGDCARWSDGQIGVEIGGHSAGEHGMIDRDMTVAAYHHSF